MALSLNGDLDLALAAFNDLIAAQPQQAALYVHRGRVYLGRNDAEHASEDFQRALELQPNYGEAAQGLAEAQECLDPDHAAFVELAAPVEEEAEEARNAATQPMIDLPEVTPPSATPSEAAAAPADATSRPASNPSMALPPAAGVAKGLIALTCLNCRGASQIRIDRLGQRFQCPKCKQRHQVDAGGNLTKIQATRSRGEEFKEWVLQQRMVGSVAAGFLILVLGVTLLELASHRGRRA